MTTVYLVTSGSYSDYRVQGVFSTSELAELAKARTGDANEIEEYELDECADALRQGFKSWIVVFGTDYQIKEVKDNSGYGESVHMFYPLSFRKDARFCDGHMYLMARDLDHATKIATDRLTVLKAENAGIIP